MVVRFFAFIRDYTGTKEMNITGAADLRELLDKLCGIYGNKLSQKLFVGDSLSEDIIIMVNGRHIEHLKGLDTKLGAEDAISIFPKVAGG